jgi:hypothetical protein
MVQEPLQLLWYVSPDDKRAIHIMETTEELIFAICSRVLSLKSSIKKLVVRGDGGNPIGHPISVLIELSTKAEVFRGDRMFKQDQDVFFKVSIVEVYRPLPHPPPPPPNQKGQKIDRLIYTYICMESF